MMVRPTNNLPPESQPWARSIEESLDQASFAALRGQENTGNSLVAINGALNQLSRQVSELNALTAQLATQQTALAAQQADLAARVAVSTSVTTFNTGTLPGDSVDRLYGSIMSLTVAVPTGKLIVTIGCGQATVAAGAAAAIASATFQIPGYVNFFDYYSRVYNGDSTYLAGAPLAVSRAFSVTPGTYTISGSMAAWAAGAGASVQFAQPYLTVQVVA